MYSSYPFQHLLLVDCRIFNDGHSEWCEVIPPSSFDLCFSNNLMLSILSYVFLSICMSFLEKGLFRYSTQFLIRLFVFLILSHISCLYILEINPLLVVKLGYLNQIGIRIWRGRSLVKASKSVDSVLCLDRSLGYEGVCICQNPMNVQLRSVHFLHTLCKVYFERKNP